ncbi:MAG: lysophospholipase [Vicinamibacteria bacterium]
MFSPTEATSEPQVIEGSFITRDGLTLSTVRFHVEKRDLMPVILIHGLADHSRALPYVELGRFLSAQGFEVFAFDRRGSGRSAGVANYASNWEELREDLSRFVDIVEDQSGRLPALVGLSFGGLQAFDFALTKPESLHSCVAMAPALDDSGSASFLKRVLPYLARFVPKISVDPGLDLTMLVRDPVLCQTYQSDPLWRGGITPALAFATTQAIARIHRRAEQIKTPLLLLHGTADRIVPISGSRKVFPRLGSQDKTFLEFPGAYHALPIEPEGDLVCGHIADWLKARVSQR